MKKMVVWKVSTKDINMASFRYRCLMPLNWLRKLDDGQDHIVVGNSELILVTRDVAAIIFVKSFSSHDLLLARRAHSLSIPIYLDLCDNLMFRVEKGFFVNENEKSILETSNRNFKEMAQLCSAIITTGQDLADEIKKVLPQSTIHLIPDPIDSEEDRRFIKEFGSSPSKFGLRKMVLVRLAFKQIHRLIVKPEFYKFALRSIYYKCIHSLTKRTGHVRPAESQQSPQINIPPSNGLPTRARKIILWFGNSGIPGLYGITDILIIKDELVELNSTDPFTLIVCSNSKDIFDRYISPLQIETQFYFWTLETNLQLLQKSDVVIIPNPENPFTVGKSANRALLALENRIPVVATRTSALAPLEGLVHFENWKINIKSIFRNPTIFEKQWDQHWGGMKVRYASKESAMKWKRLIAPD